MGNLCSKSSNEPDHFSQPGRTLGSAEAGAGAGARASGGSAAVPQKITSSTPGRTLGTPRADDGPGDARSAAAKAAEVSESSDYSDSCLRPNASIVVSDI